MNYIASMMQITGFSAVVLAVGVLAGPWWSVLAGGVILIGVGYILEPDDA